MVCCRKSAAAGSGCNLGRQAQQLQEICLARRFRAEMGLNRQKWVTDISYIQTKQGVLYLSMIRDLYDNSIVAYKTSSRQTVNLVLDTIRLAMKKEKNMVAAKLQLHSDQGFQYTSQGYFNLTQYITVLRRQCQVRETPMTTQWQKISSLF